MDLLPDDTRDALGHGLSPSDLRTLLLSVARSRSGVATSARVPHRWAEDRFVAPSRCDPRTLARVESALWNELPATFEGAGLSPLVPLGTCSVLGRTDLGDGGLTTGTARLLGDAKQRCLTSCLATERLALRAPAPS